jgi:hypothetical protein
VVVSADQPIAAIGNILGTNADGARHSGSYNGFAGGSTSISLPLIQRNNSGFSTFVSVQNGGNADANVTISYTPGSDGTATTETATIKPGAAKIFEQETNDALGAKFIGSATVASTNAQPLVATAVQVGKTVSKTQLTYDGFVGGSATVLMPLIQANNSGFFTGLSIQNAGTTATDITVTYAANVATGGTLCGTPPAQTQAGVAPGGSFVVLNNTGFFAGCKYIGAATVTNSASQTLVAIVNQLSGQTGSAYEGLNPATATKGLSMPLLFANNSGFFTGVQIQNTGATATSVTLTYGPNTATGANLCGALAAVTRTIQPGASETFFTNVGLPSAGCKYIGSGDVTSTTENVVAIVNELQQPGVGDQLLTYNAFSK